MQFIKMTWYDVVKTYFANFNLYMHLLSIDEEIDDLKKFHVYLHEQYPFNDKKARYTCIKKLGPTRNIVVGKYNRYNNYFFLFHINLFKFNNG